MQNRVDQKQDKFFDDLLDSITPKDEEMIERKIQHINFAKIIVWLCAESRKKFIFDKQELRKFLGLTNSRVQEILNDLINAGLVKKKIKSNGKTYYVLTSDKVSGVIIARKYFNRALKTLGKTPKKEITFSVEQEMKDDDYF